MFHILYTNIYSLLYKREAILQWQPVYYCMSDAPVLVKIRCFHIIISTHAGQVQLIENLSLSS